MGWLAIEAFRSKNIRPTRKLNTFNSIETISKINKIEINGQTFYKSMHISLLLQLFANIQAPNLNSEWRTKMMPLMGDPGPHNTYI